jgi:hypothetical protein
MNRIYICLAIWTLLFFYGCVEHLSRAQSREQESKPQVITKPVLSTRGEQSRTMPKEKADSNLSAIALAKAKFPDYLVGVWLGEGVLDPEVNSVAKWGIKFESDGSISKVDQPITGAVNVPEGYLYLEGPDKDTFAYFIMGKCEANYDKKTRVLKAHIVVDEYMMKFPTGDLKGRLESFLEGPVSKALDTNSIWAHPVKMVFKKQDLKE